MATKSDFIVKSGLSVNTQITVGNSSVNVTINSTSFSGTTASANNASYLNGNTAATLIGLSNNAYNNAIAYAASNTYVNNTFAPKANPTFTGVLNAADVTVSGNLVVTGNVVSVNAVTLDVADKNITVAKGAGSAAAADGAGLTVDGANATIIYTSSTDTWDFNKTIKASTFTGTANNSTYAFGKSEANLNVNNALTSNNASFLGGSNAAVYVKNTDSRTLSGNLTFTGISTHSANLVISAALIANGGPGNAGQVLTSNGSALYWANAVGNSISLTNLTLSGSLTANGSNGTGGAFLTSDGTNVYWSVPLSSSTVREQFTANGTANTFTITGGYTSGEVDVFVNGVKLYNATEVDVSSGTTIDFMTPPANGALIEVVGTKLSSSLTGNFVQNTDSRVLSGNLQFTGANVYYSTGIRIGANVIFNTSTLFVGNTTVNTYITANNIQLNGSNVITTDTVVKIYYANNTQAYP